MADFLARRWRRQPQGPVEIDWGHRLSRNLLAAVDPFSLRDLVSETPVLGVYTAPSRKSTFGGFGLYTGPNSKWTFTPRQPADTGGNRRYSIFALTSILATPTELYAGIVGRHETSFVGLITTDNATTLRATSGSGDVSTGYTLAGGKLVRAFMRANNASANQLQGGAVDTSARVTLSAAGGGAGPMDFLATWQIGGDARAGYATGRYIEQVVHWILMANEYWSADDMSLLAENPWQMVRPRRAIIYSLVASSAPTLSAAGVTAVGTTSAKPKVTLTFA